MLVSNFYFAEDEDDFKKVLEFNKDYPSILLDKTAEILSLWISKNAPGIKIPGDQTLTQTQISNCPLHLEILDEISEEEEEGNTKIIGYRLKISSSSNFRFKGRLEIKFDDNGSTISSKDYEGILLKLVFLVEDKEDGINISSEGDIEVDCHYKSLR